MFRPAMAIIRFFFRKCFRRCYTVSVTAYWWGDLVISVLLFTGSVMISGESMWKRGVSSIKPRNYTTVLLGGSGVSVRILWVLFPLCHLGSSCWGGRALWSSPVGDGEKWQVREKACIYRVIHKSLRDFRTRLRNNQDRQGRKEHINR